MGFPIYLLLAICVDAGIPIKLLYQGEGHVLTVELKNGEIYRGQLVQAEETMNCQLKDGKLEALFCPAFYTAIVPMDSLLFLLFCLF
ncbi:hypothetical protein EON64_04175 [archaeon]|nr:MAG: hypothetical protein EON64_04175 [archaeon]